MLLSQHKIPINSYVVACFEETEYAIDISTETQLIRVDRPAADKLLDIAFLPIYMSADIRSICQWHSVDNLPKLLLANIKLFSQFKLLSNWDPTLLKGFWVALLLYLLCPHHLSMWKASFAVFSSSSVLLQTPRYIMFDKWEKRQLKFQFIPAKTTVNNTQYV